MEGEFNNLTTNNIATTFNNRPNNIQTSDELTADPIYTRKMGTAYSAGKWAKRVVVAVGLTLTLTAAAMLTGSVLNNAYVVDPPSLGSVATFYLEKDNSLSYAFTISKNIQHYPITFTVYEDKDEPLLTLDCTNEGDYQGKVENLGYGKTITYDIYFTNNIDYRRSLRKGTIVTYKE